MIVENFKLDDVILVNFKSISNADTLISKDGKEYKIYTISIYLTKEQYDTIKDNYGKDYQLEYRLSKVYLANINDYIHYITFRQFNQPLIICSGVDGKISPKEVTINMSWSLIKKGKYLDFNIDLINISKKTSNNKLHEILGKKTSNEPCKSVYN